MKAFDGCMNDLTTLTMKPRKILFPYKILKEENGFFSTLAKR